MDLWNTPERQALRQTMTRFTEREIVPHLPPWEDEGQLPRSLSKAAADAGILVVGFDETVGGQGGNAIEAVEWVVSEAVQIHGGAGYLRESESTGTTVTLASSASAAGPRRSSPTWPRSCSATDPEGPHA